MTSCLGRAQLELARALDSRGGRFRTQFRPRRSTRNRRRLSSNALGFARTCQRHRVPTVAHKTERAWGGASADVNANGTDRWQPITRDQTPS